MTLEELEPVINDSVIVELWDANQDLIANYDGKDSIPDEYMYCEVNDVFTSENKLCVEIDYYEEPPEEYKDDSEIGCSDCPDDECTGHCMSCSYRSI